MPKHGKTRKSVAKRFAITRNGKVSHRTSGQDHFNARERSKVTRAKRQDRALTSTLTKTITLAINK